MANQTPGCADYYTKAKTVETVFRWSIENLLSLPFEHGKYIESRKFCSVNTPETKWRLNIYPNGETEKGKISVYLKLVSQSKVPVGLHRYYGSTQKVKVPAKVTLTMLSPKTHQYFLQQFTFNYEFHENTGYGSCSFYSHENFMRAVAEQGENNVVIVVCKIITQVKLEPTPSQCLVIGQKQEYPTSLSVDLSNLLLSEKFADFTLVSSDGLEISAHKCILSARSPVFCAMLENANMIESQQNRTTITDIDSLTLKELLQYIYTGKCDNLNTMAKELFVASDKYELTSLKVEAVQVLSGTICLENVLDICVTAHLHNASELKKIAMNFIKLNSKEIVRTSPSDWLLFVKHYPTFVTELFCT